jgi:outer membrane receptor protein involved in Fe transport
MSRYEIALFSVAFWRLLACPPFAQASAAAVAESNTPSSELEEVVVSARKRTETTIDVPISVTTFPEETLSRLNIRSFTDYATKTPNFSFSYGTNNVAFGAARSIAIRGITGPGTVGVYIDDTPVPENLDPRVVDIERIEVLKGPQGTLFGQNSLGGTLRIITVQPSPGDSNAHLEARLGATSGGGSADYGLNFAASEDLVSDRLTARIVAFVDHTAGYVTRVYPNANGTVSSANNQGADQTFGGSISFRWQAAENLSVTFRAMGQRTELHGWPAPYAPLPEFAVQSLRVIRAANVQERSSDHWYMPSLTLNYRGNGFTVTSATSYFDEVVDDKEDASEGTNWFYTNNLGLSFAPSLPIPWDVSTPQRVTSNETRVSFDPVHGISGVAGIFYAKAYFNQIDDGHYLPGIAASGLTSFPSYCPNNTTTCPSYGSDLNWFSWYPTHVTGRALFGEIYFDWRKFQLTFGLRAYRDSLSLQSLAEGASNGGYVAHDDGGTTDSGEIPKAALAYKFNSRNMGYISASKGFRLGGVSQPPAAGCGLLSELGLTPGVPVKDGSDSVWNYEIGGKSELSQGRMILTGAIFQMDWNNIQQNFILPTCNFLITVNEGAARTRGGELELSGQPLQSLELRAGIGYNDSKITEQGLPGLPPAGSRIVQIPRVTANLSGTVTRPLPSGRVGFLTVDWSYVGDSTSNTAALGYPLTRPNYMLLNASLGVRWSRSELSLYAANLTNQHANLGDLFSAGFPGHVSLNPDAPVLPRVTTLQPFNAGLQYRLRF